MEAAPSSSSPPWIELPGDVTANILSRLGVIEILESAQKVCTTWRRVCQDPAMWRVIVIRPPDRFYDSSERDELIGMCCNAVDRSQGQATDIFVENFGDDQLMNYISRRSTHLRRLTLACCCYISGKCLSEAVKKFPKLEELNLIQMSIQPKYIESIGISCPVMKSFTYNGPPLKFPVSYALDGVELLNKRYNEYAVAIATNMPNLRHLELVANTLNNTGPEKILDGCPQLESLDIRQCFNVYFGGDLGKRCREQIKHLNLPSDTTEYDYESDDSDDYGYDYYSSDDYGYDYYSSNDYGYDYYSSDYGLLLI